MRLSLPLCFSCSLLLLSIHYAKIVVADPKLPQITSPCPSGILIMSRAVAGPEKDTEWRGRLGIYNNKKFLISLTVNNPASITIDSNNDCVAVASGRTFHMLYNRDSSSNGEITFTVKGLSQGLFPNMTSLKLNGQEFCFESITGPMAKLPNSVSTEENGGQCQMSRFNPSSCGTRRIQNARLIAHGSRTSSGSFPWHTALFHQDSRSVVKYQCGGSIISPNTIITAGHCTFDESSQQIVPARMVVKVGRHKLYTPEASGREYPVFNVKLHPGYEQSLKNDIAILKLANLISFTDYVQPICLHRSGEVVGKIGTVVGWGYTEKDELADSLLVATMPVLSIVDCLESNRDFFAPFLSNTTFCAGYGNGTGVSRGDSGGGLVFEENNVWSLRGIVSLGVRDGAHYALFTDIQKYLDWIDSEL